MKKIAVALCCSIWAAVGPVAANDSTAERAAGGLVLTRSDAIDMVSEDLFVSAETVRVRYVFRNRTPRDVETIVAFPMPDDVLSERDGGDVAFPHDFATLVDGRPVKMALEQRAVVGGKDHSAVLKALGVPLSDGAEERIEALRRTDQDRLIALGLVTVEDAGAPGRARQLAPAWTLKESYHWTQSFPAGRDLVVEHRYVPGTGGSVGTDFTLPGFRESAEGRAYAARYCVDAAFLAGIDRLARQARGELALPEQRVSYVLRTGANWRAPIGSFRLVVDKGAPANLVSFCGDGVRKISPTQFEVRHQNWRPDRDLNVLIVEPRG